MIKIEQLKMATPVAVEELIVLGRELHSDERKMSREELEEILRDDSAILMTVQDDGHIIGMASLYVIPKIGSRNALLEDVIVSTKYRGQGLGEKLVQALIDIAKVRRVKSISLTSRPVRIAAHKLYEKLGFKIKETDVFKLSL
jgi:ribosomal protein S18 acetylase RimI-like enzyme